jgi:hypothetical protein
VVPAERGGLRPARGHPDAAAAGPRGGAPARAGAGAAPRLGVVAAGAGGLRRRRVRRRRAGGDEPRARASAPGAARAGRLRRGARRGVHAGACEPRPGRRAGARGLDRPRLGGRRRRALRAHEHGRPRPAAEPGPAGLRGPARHLRGRRAGAAAAAGRAPVPLADAGDLAGVRGPRGLALRRGADRLRRPRGRDPPGGLRGERAELASPEPGPALAERARTTPAAALVDRGVEPAAPPLDRSPASTWRWPCW